MMDGSGDPRHARAPDGTTSSVRALEDLRARLRHHADHPQEIDQRLHDLRCERNLEVTLRTWLLAVAVAGGIASMLGLRAWRLVTVGATALRMQFMARGWCAPASLLHAWGVRTRSEIAIEYHLLRVLRGDEDQRLAGTYRDAHERLPLVLGALET